MEAKRSVLEDPSWARVEFLFSGEALAGLEVERTVSDHGKRYYSRRGASVLEMIRLGDDPSRTLNTVSLRRGAHRAGGEKIRLGDDPSRR